MKGFFSVEKQLLNDSQNKHKMLTCASCGMYQFALSPRMQPYGKLGAKILNIGEAPGAVEDERGRPWQGKAGRTLFRMYKKLGIHLFDDCLNNNSCSCRPTRKTGGSRTPTSKEVAACRARVWKVIKENKPKLIVLFGDSALESFLGHRWRKDLGKLTKWRGWVIPDRDCNAWVCATFHPSFVMRQENPETELIWGQDLQRAMGALHQPFPEQVDEQKQIEYITCAEAGRRLLALPVDSVITLDYETTGLKPQLDAQKIVCAAIADRIDRAYAFMTPDKAELRKTLRVGIKKRKLRVIAANMKFEENWTKEKLRFSIGDNWYFDTMLGARILDNRAGISGLKFQTYVNFGVVDYDSLVSSYLKGTEEKNGNSLNRIFEFIKKYGEKELLQYCGLDALFEYKLAMKMITENNLL